MFAKCSQNGRVKKGIKDGCRMHQILGMLKIFTGLSPIKFIKNFFPVMAFAFSTAGGVIFAKIMNVVTRGKVNPLIGSAGVSAVPMAARVAQTEGKKYNPKNFLLMHAMGPNVAGVIGSAVAAGFLLAMFGK